MLFTRRSTAIAVLFCLGLLLTACGDEEEPTPYPEDTRTADAQTDVADAGVDGGDASSDVGGTDVVEDTNGGPVDTTVDDAGADTGDTGGDADDGEDATDATDTAGDTGGDGTDAVDVAGDTVGGDVSDGGETDTGGGGISCNYQNDQDGVCKNSTLLQNGNCKEPNDYQSDESKCDGKDNDCDGTTDENCPCAYQGDAKGVCGSAKIDPSTGSCAEPNEYEPDESSCDGADNDCDGKTDENLTQSCYTGPAGTAGVGVCAKGTQSCSSGSWGKCMNETTPSSEMCNGKDDDCDGKVDEGVTGSTSPGDSCSRDCECTAGVCKNGTCPHRVFVSTGRYDPQFGSRFSSTGLDEADQTCGTLASGENLGGSWSALMSDGMSDAKSRLGIDAPIILVDGTKVADGQSDLWDGTIDHAIDIDQAGNQVSGMSGAWTGTTSNGRSSNTTCRNWTSNGGFRSGTSGNTSSTNSSWIRAGDIRCDRQRHLYCIEQ